MKKISEIISANEILQWKNTDIITITAGTGSGKSYFIKNTLYNLCKLQNKKILMLIHRNNCVNQFQKEINRDKKADIIKIKTYQVLESMIYNHKDELDFSEYEYIVCDEFHYFLSDAAFNKTTDISLNLILAQSNITRIFMSATSKSMKRYIKNVKKIETKDYELEANYDFIDELTFFNRDETMESFIEEIINKNSKGIFFIESAKKAYNLYKKNKEYCLFNCSKSNSRYYKYVDEDKINNMLINEKFNEPILITTTCLDAGVNIIDTSVKHIFIDVEDIGSLIQCMGRRRIQNKNDKICIYIKNINNQQLGGKEVQLKKKVKMADFLKNHTVKKYIEKYSRELDYSNIVYDEIVNEDNKGTKKINEVMYFKCKWDIMDIAEMKEYGKFGYCNYLKKLFKFNRNYRLIEEEIIKEDLENYLESIVGQVMLTVKDRKELIDKIDVKSNGKQLKKINNLNGALEEIQISFRIVEFQTSRMINGKKKNFKNAWKVDKLVS